MILNLHTRPGLLFYINQMIGLQRLCIPFNLVKDIISLTHNNGHLGFIRCYKIVALL